VDSVQLVFQQHAVLKANLDQPMDMFCGEMGCDMWSKKHWEDIYSKNMVIVCTAEVLRQCLHRSFISMDRINLLIFDEAHHAKKDHPYARIIKDFYVGSENGAILPKIFGMTASPVDAIVDVAQAAAELEAILHAQIATTADPSFMQYRSNDLLEKAVPYQVLGPKFETALFSQMRERFKANLVLAKPLVFALQATRELGTWCADQVWPFCLTEEETQKLQAKTERRYHAKKIQEPLEILEARKVQLREAKDIVAKHTFDPPDLSTLPEISDGPAFLPASVPLPEYRALPGSTNLSSKVVNLIHLLQQRFHRQTDDKCIVFANQRYTARLLAKLFTQPGVGTPHLFVGTLASTLFRSCR
jgi:endoribonuclease Dicer